MDCPGKQPNEIANKFESRPLYGSHPYIIMSGRKVQPMSRQTMEGGRIELRIKPEEKAILARAAALEHVDLTGFILRKVLPEARAVIDRAERVTLSERDSFKVLDLLERPPKPTARLKGAAKAGQTLR